MGNKVRLRNAGGYSGVYQWNNTVDSGYVPYQANLSAGNLLYGVDIFGVVGTATILPAPGSSAGQWAQNSATKAYSNTNIAVSTQLYSFTVSAGVYGTQYLHHEVYSVGSVGVAYYDVKVNGVVQASFSSGVYPSGNSYHITAVTVKPSDVVSVWGMAFNGSTVSDTCCFATGYPLAT